MTADREEEETAAQRNNGTTKTEGQYHGPTNKRVRGPYTKPKYIEIYSRQWKLN